MSQPYDTGTSSTPNPQREPQHHHHHHQSSSHRSPLSASVSHPEDSPTSGRQRVRTEPSPRHQHTSSGWLGPYNEQPSPIPSLKSPRNPRLPGGLPSSAAMERGALSAAGVERVPDTHREFGDWQMDSGGSSTIAVGAPVGGFERRPFDPKHTDVGFPGPSMEASNSLQSLVESIDDENVFKLTEMTKKRVEHNNPAQKRQRVTSLPTSEISTAANFQPSEKTLQFSSSCKSYLESRYSQLYQSINAGHPINRLRRLHEILPHIKSLSVSKPAHDGKTSMDGGGSRSRRWKSDKYRFVDKVEESSCIWDVDHMEAKAAAEAAAEAAALAKQDIVASSRQGSQLNLDHVAPSTSHDSGHHQLSSASTDSFGVENPLVGDSYAAGSTVGTQPYHDSPLVAVDGHNLSAETTPSGTFLSITGPNHAHEPATTSFSSFGPASLKQKVETLPESNVRLVEPYLSTQQSILTPAIKFPDGGNMHTTETAASESSPSKRNSFLGMLGVRGKKVEQDSDHPFHLESPQSSAYGSPRLTATASAYERPSFDSQYSPYFQPTLAPSQSLRNQHEVMQPSPVSSPSGNTNNSTTPDTQMKRSTSTEDAVRAAEYGEAGPNALIDDDNGGHYTPASQWPQGECVDSQDESENAAAATNKRSSLRRLKDKMAWMRGPKPPLAIQQGDTPQNLLTNGASTKLVSSDGIKSLGKKVDPSLAYLHGQGSFGRVSSSEPSSGRNSIDGSSRPKLNFRVLSSSSSPVLEAVKSPDGSSGVYSPRVGPSSNAADSLIRMERSPSANLLRIDKSPMINPTSRIEKSPMLNSTRMEKSPLLVPASMFAGEELSGNGTPIHADITKSNMCVAQQLLVEVERLPKRLLQKLKQRPELASIDWTAETVDLSAMWSSPEPIPTYEEYVGISDIMKSSKLYPNYLGDIDVLEIRLMLVAEEPKDIDSKNRMRRWDLLEMRVDQELDHGEKWIKEVSNWSDSKASAIERHQRSEEPKSGPWRLDENSALVEEPEAEDGADTLASETALDIGEGDKSSQMPHAAPLESLQARKQQHGLSLSSVRYGAGSMSSLHTSVTYNFKASMETTREAIDEMRVYIVECRQRLKQLHDATGSQLREKEPIFKEVVDKFTMEWNESYFVKLKEVEDQIQVMNLKRIENPWMDMLLIMLSWFIRGLFYIVEAVTIMIIVVRHAWGNAKKGYGAIRNSRREQERLSHSGGNSSSSSSGGGDGGEKTGTNAAGASGSIPNGAPTAKDLASGNSASTSASSGNDGVNAQLKTVGAWT